MPRPTAHSMPPTSPRARPRAGWMDSLSPRPATGRTSAFSAILALGLTACGGGGGGGTSTDSTPIDTGIPATATAQFVAGQNAANALVRELEARTRDMQLANGLANAATPVTPTAAQPGERASLHLPRLPRAGMKQAQAVESLTSDLCSSGTATMDVADSLVDRFNKDPNATLLAGDKLVFAASQCTIKASLDLGDVALGNFGVGSQIQGQFTLEVLQNSASNLLLQISYVGFTWAPYQQAAYPSLDAVIRFGNQAGQSVYSLDINGLKFIDQPLVAAQGGQVTVSQGTVRARLPAVAGSGYADMAYKGWTFQLASGRATAGSVLVSGVSGHSAQVTASATGYAVSLTVGGSTQQYQVAL